LSGSYGVVWHRNGSSATELELDVRLRRIFLQVMNTGKEAATMHCEGRMIEFLALPATLSDVQREPGCVQTGPSVCVSEVSTHEED